MGSRRGDLDQGLVPGQTLHRLAREPLGRGGLEALDLEFAQVDHTTPEAFAAAAQSVIRAARAEAKVLALPH